ncbi:hypothetical protein DRH29_03285 [candidate division Kazan bacterium]|uniref:Uncharacterized protein n=1 Tax=candidate division Kazan bacterium TaxID=2202143 RepID=A0A420ZCE1_UNCK3|nr:MAG: hypothetical protein DRH29_03285 [candidate division Kazan bacterium]
MREINSKYGKKWLVEDGDFSITSLEDGREEWRRGELVLSVYWTKLKTDKGRTLALVDGENLDGLVGLSRGEDGFHIGTPFFAFSSRLYNEMTKVKTENGWVTKYLAEKEGR